jgi:calcineurin-like phosphoesterase family protein
MGRSVFSCLKEHDDIVMDQLNSTVGRNDRLYILGDFCFSNPARYRQKIRCKHIEFIIGNHDKPGLTEKSFGRVWHIRCTKFSNGEKVVLCHYPMAYWPASHYNAYHLYGHMHGRREYDLTNYFPSRRSMDVGVDEAYRLLGAYRPFSEDEILTHLYPRAGHDPVSFYRGTS